MTLQEVSELVSLALTVPTVVLGCIVVYLWFPHAKSDEGLMFDFKNFTAPQWFIAGVTIGFIGSVLDNLYWSIPWMSAFLGLGIKDQLMDAGVFFNIFFRQTCGIMAAYCHLMAGRKSVQYFKGVTLSEVLRPRFVILLFTATAWVLIVIRLAVKMRQ